VGDVDKSKCWPEVNDGTCQSRIVRVYKMAMFSTHFKHESTRPSLWVHEGVTMELISCQDCVMVLAVSIIYHEKLSSVRPISSPPRHSSCKSSLCHSLLDIGYTASPYAAPFHFHVALQNAGLPTDMAHLPSQTRLSYRRQWLRCLSHSLPLLERPSTHIRVVKRSQAKADQAPSDFSTPIFPPLLGHRSRHHRASPLLPTHSRTRVHPSTQSYTSRRHSCLAPCPQT